MQQYKVAFGCAKNGGQCPEYFAGKHWFADKIRRDFIFTTISRRGVVGAEMLIFSQQITAKHDTSGTTTAMLSL